MKLSIGELSPPPSLLPTSMHTEVPKKTETKQNKQDLQDCRGKAFVLEVKMSDQHEQAFGVLTVGVSVRSLNYTEKQPLISVVCAFDYEPLVIYI